MPEFSRNEWLRLPANERVAAVGHRAKVGGAEPEKWYGIGRLQYHFLVMNGLQTHHRFLDIACGALRLGQFVIPYLDKGCYFGLDEEPSLVSAAFRHEIPAEFVELKAPSFAFNSDFNFDFIETFDIAWANSLVTHLGPEMIALLLGNLRSKAHPGSRFFFTYWPGNQQPGIAYHPNMDFRITPSRLAEIGAQTGWKMTDIGDWNHPRQQLMMLAEPA